MSASVYLLEVGCEEIPARFMPGLCRSLAELTETKLSSERVGFKSVSVDGTYRRLVLHIAGIAAKQADEESWIKGPPVSIAIDDSGAFTQAGQGFAKKQGVSVTDLDRRDVNGNEHVGVLVANKGLPIEDWLQGAIPELLASIPLPVAMRWANKHTGFVRPVQWLVSMLNNDVVPCTFLQVEAGNITYGHRMLSDGPTSLGKPLTLSTVADYESSLQAAQVCVSSAQRREIIVKSLSAANQHSPDTGLLEETVYLAEQPIVIKGQFDARFLDLPAGVLVACMKKHQRYFPVYNSQGELENSVLIVADNVTEENKTTIIRGNERVLAARLEDALFFYKEDQTQPLAAYTEKLAGLTFHKSAGTVLEKQQRIQAIMQALCTQGVGTLETAAIERISQLAKADLVTQMVVEFPSLQGKMGGTYARLSGEPDHVAVAIEEQYLPAGAQSGIPQSEGGIVLALADRLDTIVALFHGGVKASGSQDPLGLRRAVNGVFQICYEAQRSCDIPGMLDVCYGLLAGEPQHRDRLNAFISTRVKTLLGEWGLDKKMAAAVEHIALQSPCRAVKLGKAVAIARDSAAEKFKTVSETAIRVHRLAQKATNTEIDATLFESDHERAVHSAIEAINGRELGWTDLDKLSAMLVPFFDDVLVMAENPAVKANRLALLKRCDQCFCAVAHFEAL